MPALNVRDVTPEQMEMWKAAASACGLTLREWVMSRLTVGVEGARQQYMRDEAKRKLQEACAPRTAKAKPEEIAPTPARKTTQPEPARPAPRQRLEIDPTLPDYIETQPTPPTAAARSIHTGSYQRPEHDAATCRSYGCLMCKAAKRP